LGKLLARLNWLCLFETWRTGRFHSAVPGFGAVFMAAGLLLLPGTRPYAWIAVPADYGTMALLIALPRIVREAWKTSPYNLLEEYVGVCDRKAVCLRLFRDGAFTVEQRFRLQPGEPGLIRAGTIGTWDHDTGRLALRMDNGESAEFEIVEPNPPTYIKQVVGLPAYEGGMLSLAGVELMLRRTNHSMNRST
jgi:hypothetical protein